MCSFIPGEECLYSCGKRVHGDQQIFEPTVWGQLSQVQLPIHSEICPKYLCVLGSTLLTWEAERPVSCCKHRFHSSDKPVPKPQKYLNYFWPQILVPVVKITAKFLTCFCLRFLVSYDFISPDTRNLRVSVVFSSDLCVVGKQITPILDDMQVSFPLSSYYEMQVLKFFSQSVL